MGAKYVSDNKRKIEIIKKIRLRRQFRNMKEPELSSTAEKIDRLIKKIDSGDIRIPAFQRSYVWKQNQIIDLLDSIIANYPIGSILLWYTSERIKYTRNIAGYLIPETQIEYPVNYVLDGQQRLSSIYAVFSNRTEQDRSTEKYNPNLDIFEIYYDFETQKFKPVNEVNPTKSNIIHLKNLIETTRLIPALQTIDSIYHSEASKLCSKFINYEIPVATIKNRTKEEVGIIFERINNTGTRLSTLDLMTAWTWTDDFHLLEATNELTTELDEKGFGEIPYNIILQAISAVIRNDTSTSSILKLEGETIRENWEFFCEAIKKTVDFLTTEMKCSSSDFLPYTQQIIGISKFFSIAGTIELKHLEALKKWFWRTSFSNRHSTGLVTHKMNGDIETMIQIRRGNFSELDNYAYTTSKKELISIQFSKANSLSRAFLLLMAQSAPLDLITATTVDLGSSLSKFNKKEYHHVFPRAFLTKKGVPNDKINCVANICFLPSKSNKKILSKEPKRYFSLMVPQENFDEILESNLLPTTKSLYENNDYDKFLDERTEKIITLIQKVTGQ